MDKFEAFNKLKEYSNDLTTVSYEEVYDLLNNEIRKIPIPTAKVRKGTFIDRVRKNKDAQLYKSLDELGYIKDQNLIDNHMNSFGRANRPHQVMFYGAIETSHIDKQRLTALAETSKLFREPNLNNILGEHYTVSRWNVLEDFLVAEVVFSEYALANNKDIRISYENQKKFLEGKDLKKEEIDFHLDFLKFISEQFSKRVENNEEYKICAAYTNIVLQYPNVNGIAYPSVQTDYFGVNIVLPPKVVDAYLTPILLGTQTIYKNGQNTLIVNGQYYSDEIDTTKDIVWKENDKSILTDYTEVKKRIKL